MPVDKESRLALWIGAVREWAPTVRPRLVEWWEVIRENPVLIWQTPAVRYSVYGLGLIVAVLVLQWGASLLLPPQMVGSEPARTAQFHVLCSNPSCGHHFVIERKFKFKDFPVQCPKCHQQTGHRAVRVNTGPDRGKWVIQR